MKKVLKVIGAILLIIIVLTSGLFIKAWLTPSAPRNYETVVNTGGEIESKYLAHGSHEVSYFEEKTEEIWEKYEVYYPSDLKNSDEIYPLIIVANGSGVKASKYKTVFRHYASWGFIVIGNEHDNSWAGDSTEASLCYILEQNEDPDSVLYQKVDPENIGVVGHSQGGVGVFTSVTQQPHKDMYKCAVALSPSCERLAASINWNYDITEVMIPVLMLAGTEGEFETELVIPLEDMQSMYDRLTVPKIMARKSEMEHGEMLYSADGYVTAWFMWQLQGDKDAAKAFIGNDPELLQNPLYQDQKIQMTD